MWQKKKKWSEKEEEEGEMEGKSEIKQNRWLLYMSSSRERVTGGTHTHMHTSPQL